MANKVTPLPWDKLMKKSSIPKLINDWVHKAMGGRRTAEMKLGQYYVFDRKVLDKVFKGMKNVKINQGSTFKRASKTIELPAALRGKKLLNTTVGKTMLDEMERFIVANFNKRDKQFKSTHPEKYKSMYGRSGKSLARNTRDAPSTAHRWIVKHYEQISTDWEKVIAPEITDI